MTKPEQQPKPPAAPATKQNQGVMDYLNALQPMQIAKDTAVKEKFIALYNRVHNSNQGEQVYYTEEFYYTKALQEKPDLQACTKLSLYGAFMDLAINGLSIDPSSRLAYLIVRNANTAPRGAAKVYEKRAFLETSPTGELTIRVNKGQILHADNPVIVYKGDEWGIGTNEVGKNVVKYMARIPRESEEIVGGFIRIVRIDGSVDFAYLMQGDIARLKKFSEKNNQSAGANDLYTSGFNGGIDAGFFRAKILRHAFASYPKVIKGEFSRMAGEEEIEEAISYDLQSPAAAAQPAASMPAAAAPAPPQPAAAPTPPSPDFTPTQPAPAAPGTVRITPEQGDDDTF